MIIETMLYFMAGSISWGPLTGPKSSKHWKHEFYQDLSVMHSSLFLRISRKCRPTQSWLQLAVCSGHAHRVGATTKEHCVLIDGGIWSAFDFDTYACIVSNTALTLHEDKRKPLGRSDSKNFALLRLLHLPHGLRRAEPAVILLVQREDVLLAVWKCQACWADTKVSLFPRLFPCPKHIHPTKSSGICRNSHSILDLCSHFWTVVLVYSDLDLLCF